MSETNRDKLASFIKNPTDFYPLKEEYFSLMDLKQEDGTVNHADVLKLTEAVAGFLVHGQVARMVVKPVYGPIMCVVDDGTKQVRHGVQEITFIEL